MSLDFAKTFADLAGYAPFPWQQTLFERLLAGRIPSCCDLPTGLGKTSVIAIWLIARAAGAPVPRRLVYVVDRRAVVDQATLVAERLRDRVAASAGLTDALRLPGPLAISTLRGKYLDNRAWLADPSAPAIVLGTVDMIGSRLLFEGYGVSRKMRPYHAALLGADSLIVLDEAHLVPPFERLIETIASARDGVGCSLAPEGDLAGLVPRVRLLSLSATGRKHQDSLTLGKADREHLVVARRINARKRVSIHPEVAPRALPEALAEAAWQLCSAGTEAMRCIIFASSRDDAQQVQDGLLARKRKAGIDGIEAELFVGGRRLFEREAAGRWLEARGFFAGTDAQPQHATFVIATSAGEVGVDLDADHMVCDLVAWERMVQRLGRVNRRGEGDAHVVIVPRESDDDSVRARLAAVLEVLNSLPRHAEGTLDASPGALIGMKAAADSDSRLAALIERASSPVALHPALLRPTVEAWSMTSLEEHTGRPTVGPWIRGWIEEDDPQTTVVWRRYLPITDDGSLFAPSALEAFRDSADPHLSERLETETWRVVDWLLERLSDKRQSPEGTPSPGRGEVIAVVLDGQSKRRTLTALSLPNKNDLVRELAGALLLVDVRLGGLSHGLLDASSDVATDVTEIDDDARVVPFRLRRIDAADAPVSAGFRTEARLALDANDEGATAWLAIESACSGAAESEEGRSVGARNAQTLTEHQSWTEEAARNLGRRLGLPQGYIEMLATAAWLHDEGKRAVRWQRAFRAPRDTAYAKTTARPNLDVLGGYRHELGSLPHAERDARFQALEPDLRELCLHLIAAHHGHARPLIRIDGAEEPPTRLAGRAREIALRFASLERRWGPWGLAWWETLLRAADQRASQRNDDEVRHG